MADRKFYCHLWFWCLQRPNVCWKIRFALLSAVEEKPQKNEMYELYSFWLTLKWYVLKILHLNKEPMTAHRHIGLVFLVDVRHGFHLCISFLFICMVFLSFKCWNFVWASAAVLRRYNAYKWVEAKGIWITPNTNISFYMQFFIQFSQLVFFGDAAKLSKTVTTIANELYCQISTAAEDTVEFCMSFGSEFLSRQN